MVSIEELRLHLNGLISDRKELTSELEDLKDKLKEGPPAKVCVLYALNLKRASNV